MKILYLSHTSKMHGSGKAVLNIMLQMIEKGVEVCVILPINKGELFDNIKNYNIPYSIIRMPSFIWPKISSLRDWCLFPYRICKFFITKCKSEKQLTKIIKAYNPDIIHTNVGITHTGYYVAKKLRVPHIWHIREYQDLHFGWKTFPSRKKHLQLLAHKNNYPIAITNDIYRHYDLSRNKNSTVMYDGVFDSKSIPEIKANKKKYFLFVGMISEGKGVNEAIQGFISIANNISGYELWIAGNGDIHYIKKIKEQCSQSNCDKKIIFLGHRTDVYQLMQEATALIVPSRFEGFGFITVEAMLNGCIVIGRNTAGTKEQFDNGFAMHGEEIGFRYTTVTELSTILNKIANENFTKYLPIINNAQKTVIDLYSFQLNAENIFKLYNQILLQK